MDPGWIHGVDSGDSKKYVCCELHNSLVATGNAIFSIEPRSTLYLQSKLQVI